MVDIRGHRLKVVKGISYSVICPYFKIYDWRERLSENGNTERLHCLYVRMGSDCRL